MSSEKIIRKNIRFNFFEVILKVDENIFQSNCKVLKKIEKLKEKEKRLTEKEQQQLDIEEDMIIQNQKLKNYEADSWNMKNMLEYISLGKMSNTSIEVDDVFVEIEPNSFTTIEDEIISFQLSKLRDNFLPAKKKLGKEKEDIILTDEEYIGEFVSVIYDCKYCTAMVQSNMYGLSTSKIEKYFTELRKRYIEEKVPNDAIKELACKLRVLIDPNKAEKVLDSKYFRKIRVKGSDTMMDSFIDSNSLFGKVRKNLGNTKGINFDITFSVNSTDKTESLDFDEVNNLVEDFKSIPKNERKPLVEITKKDNDDSNVELVNLLYPRLTDIISFKIKPRQSIGHEFLYQKMKEAYSKRRCVIARILRPF